MSESAATRSGAWRRSARSRDEAPNAGAFGASAGTRSAKHATASAGKTHAKRWTMGMGYGTAQARSASARREESRAAARLPHPASPGAPSGRGPALRADEACPAPGPAPPLGCRRARKAGFQRACKTGQSRRAFTRSCRCGAARERRKRCRARKKRLTRRADSGSLPRVLHGVIAKRLGRGLQILPERFDSASRLHLPGASASERTVRGLRRV